jgi:hypothetical protein
VTVINRYLSDFAGLEIPVIEVVGDKPGPLLSVVTGGRFRAVMERAGGLGGTTRPFGIKGVDLVARNGRTNYDSGTR